MNEQREPTFAEIVRASNDDTLYTQRWWRAAVRVLLRDGAFPEQRMPGQHTMRDALLKARRVNLLDGK